MTARRRTARRFPRFPHRDEVPDEERASYDHMVERWIEPHTSYPEVVDGRPWGVQHFEALAIAPRVGVALMQLGDAVTEREGAPGTISHQDHEMIDQVLALDANCLALLAGHTPVALKVGVRPDALEALADRREEDLTADERQQAQFIRAVRDGTMTDGIWDGMLQRLGTERGVVEYVALVLIVLFHQQFARALGAAEMSIEDWRRMVHSFKRGDRPIHPGSELS